VLAVRADQYEKMKALAERLADAVIEEADPDNWSGKGKNPADLTREERGDRYWCKKNAAATLSVLMRVSNVTGVLERTLFGTGTPADPEKPAGEEGETDLDREVNAAEKDARRLLAKLQQKPSGRAN
jgi:hypothetical protein